MSKATPAARLVAALLEQLIDRVRAEGETDDASAVEVLETLSIAWMAAERWRIEQSGDFDAGFEAPAADDFVTN